MLFLSTLSLRRATIHSDSARDAGSISIHALLAESDVATRRMIFAAAVFLSTLSLRRATTPLFGSVLPVRFLSTLSLRRATHTFYFTWVFKQYFYPRSPCGERPDVVRSAHHPRAISIHALLAESDWWKTRQRPRNGHFYPRSPCGERLYVRRMSASASTISIHALLAESDLAGQKLVKTNTSISIHALLAESDSKSAQNSGALLRI